jgi:BirA family biotin operon repressor/biotin-[acetyl-CoA-carboxylase] ligase
VSGAHRGGTRFAAAWRLAIHETLPSTSELCRSLAAAGEPEGLAVLARRQTAGRGRRGRLWQSPAGNLSLSVLLRPQERAQTAGEWSLLAAVAAAEAVATLLPVPHGVTVKWPNDVLLDGAKLAGVLLDSAAEASGDLAWLVIGVGANLANAPTVPGRRTACVADVAPPPAPEVFAQDLLARLEVWRRRRELDGFAPVRAAWLARAAPLGSAATLRIGECVVAGRFAGLSEQGALLLETQGAVRAFATGEILQ